MSQEVGISDIGKTIERLLRPLTEEQKNELLDASQVWHMTQGDKVFADGDEPVYLYYVVAGKVRMECEGIDGRSFVVRMIEPHGCFGYSSLFARKRHYTNAIAAAGTVVITVPLTLVVQLMERNSGFAMVLVCELSELLSQTVTRTVSLTQKHVRGRLADCLLSLVEQFGLDENDRSLPIYLSRNELAQMSNMAPNNAIRTLSQFASEGVVGIEGRKLRILNLDMLKRIAKLG